MAMITATQARRPLSIIALIELSLNYSVVKRLLKTQATPLTSCNAFYEPWPDECWGRVEWVPNMRRAQFDRTKRQRHG